MSKKSSRMPRKSREGVRVLAIDPGFGRAGMAVLERTSGKDILLYSSCVVTNKTDDFSKRLHLVCTAARKLITDHRPTLFAIERLYFATNQKTAMQVAEVRGALLALAAAHDVIIVEYTPLQVKVAVTGFGRSGKREIMKMIPLLVKFPEEKKRLDDEYDAIAIGLTALASYRLE